jgi:hypothetical protein
VGRGRVIDWIVITGVRPYDGRYEFDLADQEPTTREWGWIKRLSGYLPVGIGDGLEGADPELFCVFAAIALKRAGKITQQEVEAVFNRLADAPFPAAVRLESDELEDAEGDAGPPPSSSNGSSSTSGDSSTTSSESSDSDPSPTGTPASATSVSVPARWGN